MGPTFYSLWLPGEEKEGAAQGRVLVPSPQLCFLGPELPLPLDSRSSFCEVGAERRAWAAAFCFWNHEGAGAGPVRGWRLTT